MYLIGQFTQRASIIKFQKSNMNVDWKLEIKDATGAVSPASDMNEIYSFTQPINDEWIYACGYKWFDPFQETFRQAVTMKVSTDGELQFVQVWGDIKNNDACRAVSFDESRREVVFMFEATSPSLRPSYSRYSKYSGSNTDILIVTMKESGQLMGGWNINMDTASVSLYIGDHSFFVKDGQYIFGGQSYGYKTKF